MTDNALTPLDTAPATDVLKAHLNVLVSDAYESLKAVYDALQAGGDPEEALIALDSHVTALHEFGDQSIAIQAGLIAFGAEMTTRLEDAVRRDETISQSLDEAIPGLLDVAADPDSGSVQEVLKEYALETPEISQAIIDEHEASLTGEVQDLIVTLRDEGLHADADELEEQLGLVAQARDKLGDLIESFTAKLNEHAEHEFDSVEPMVFDDEAEESEAATGAASLIYFKEESPCIIHLSCSCKPTIC